MDCEGANRVFAVLCRIWDGRAGSLPCGVVASSGAVDAEETGALLHSPRSAGGSLMIVVILWLIIDNCVRAASPNKDSAPHLRSIQLQPGGATIWIWRSVDSTPLRSSEPRMVNHPKTPGSAQVGWSAGLWHPKTTDVCGL